MGFPCRLEGCSLEVVKGLCSGCKEVHYCCKEHQTEDWKRHKKECKEKAKKSALQEKGKGKDAEAKFHLEYKEAYPNDPNGFSILKTWFDNIEKDDMVRRMILMVGGPQGHCILQPFGTVEENLCKRWEFPMDAARGILDFLREEGNTVGQVCRGHPKLAKAIPYGSGVHSDGTYTQMIKMQNMRNTPSQKLQMERGKTYVSLGFVDLQQVKEADLNLNLNFNLVSTGDGGGADWAERGWPCCLARVRHEPDCCGKIQARPCHA